MFLKTKVQLRHLLGGIGGLRPAPNHQRVLADNVPLNAYPFGVVSVRGFHESRVGTQLEGFDTLRRGCTSFARFGIDRLTPGLGDVGDVVPVSAGTVDLR
jgi:hypothetical protein